MTKEYIKDTVKYLPSKIVPGIIGFLSIYILTRLFSPEDYGDYSLVRSTVMMLAVLTGWLPTSIVRFYPGYERDKKLGFFYGNAVRLGLLSVVVVGALFSIILFLTRGHFSERLISFMHIGTGLFVAGTMFDLLSTLLRSRRMINWYSVFVLSCRIAGLALGLSLAVFFNMGVRGLLWGAITSNVVLLPLLWRKVKEKVIVVKERINWSLAKNMAIYSFPLVVGNLAAWILSLSDRYILQFFWGSHEVGIYSASYNIVYQSIMLLSYLMGVAVGPLGMHMWENEGEEKTKIFRAKVTRYFLIVCVPSAVGLSVLAKPILSVLTGEMFFEGYKIFPFVVCGAFFLGLQARFHGGFLYHKKTSPITFGIIASGLLNLVLNFLFIPKYGYMAAAITTFISYTFLLFLMVVLSRRLFAWKFPFKSLRRSLYASGIMGIGVYFLGNNLLSYGLLNLLVSVCAGGLIYVSLLFLFKEFEPDEVRMMLALKEKLWARIRILKK